MRLLVLDNKHLKCLNASRLLLTNCAEKQAGSGMIGPYSLYSSDAIFCKYYNYLVSVSGGSVLCLCVC